MRVDAWIFGPVDIRHKLPNRSASAQLEAPCIPRVGNLEKEFSDDHDRMCSKPLSRISWSWSSFFSSPGASFQRTMTIRVASLLTGYLGHGHRLFFLSKQLCRKPRAKSRQTFSPTRAKNAAKLLAKNFTDFRPSISRRIGCKKCHKKSSANSKSHEIRFFHHMPLGACGHNKTVVSRWWIDFATSCYTLLELVRFRLVTAPLPCRACKNRPAMTAQHPYLRSGQDHLWNEPFLEIRANPQQLKP